MFKRVPGTKDILPEEVSAWQEIEHTSRNVFSLYNYRQIRPPVIEDAGLFSRSLGEFTEVVQKQMFLIKREDETYALRPEGTAPIVRAYIENNLDKTAGFIKLYYIGPMFRAERPQKGRLRQFHHIGCEVIGSVDPDIDVEVISLAHTLLTCYGISGYSIKLNSLGCSHDKKELTSVLRKALQPKLAELCDECKARFDKNILRVLDCKNESCRKIVNALDFGHQHLCADCQAHFAKVRQGLDNLKVPYELNPHLVRGLDYYTRTVFEISHPGLGSQDALGAGGRYDNLVEELGGSPAGAIGFAFGVERLLLARGEVAAAGSLGLVYVIALGPQAKEYGIKLLAQLRTAGIPSDTDYENKSLKGAMRAANDLAARYAVIIGDDELKNNTVTLKDMRDSQQKVIKSEDLIKELKK
ncbi:MAG TPA: histidine--tRNA ligase [Patescibacteria group bacterium]|nr:histidine--tRNA ligase [Patescibacteria group bacterium]